MKMSAVLQKHFTQQRKKVNVQDKLFLSYFCPILFFALNENMLYFYKSYINNANRHDIMLFKMSLFSVMLWLYLTK